MPLLLLDRDGVLNEDKHDYVKSLDELVLIPQAIEAVGIACKAGYTVAVCTNQGCIEKGWLSLEGLAAIHARIQDAVQASGGHISHFYFSPHAQQHPMRKPTPGMLLQALHNFNGTAANTAFVGDALRDIEAGYAAGCQPVLVRTGIGKQTEAQLPEHPHLSHTRIYDCLMGAVRGIVGA
jgi:D-glycero-D-manno-heptose 1,7-bisphosphate phosphatase